MAQKRSIQDIIPPARSQPLRKMPPESNAVHQEEVTEEKTAFPTSKNNRKKNNNPRPGGTIFGLITIALVIVIFIISAFVIVSTLFHRADVSITLNEFDVTVAQAFNASPDGVLLSFTEVTTEETQSTTVPRSGTQFVEDRASGTITILNEFSSAKQRLITNTRFETEEGLIFRVKTPVVVPGFTIESGKKIPGRLDVTVYADEPGDQYNIQASEFTIPGLRGSPQFSDMYARSDGAFFGGFVGEKAVVDEATKDAAVAQLKRELEGSVVEKMRSGLSDSELLFEDNVTVTFRELGETINEDGALVSVVAIATAPVFLEEQLAKVIAIEGGVSFENPLRIGNLDEIAILTKDIDEEGIIEVTISGEARLVGAYNQESLIEDLSGKNRQNVGVVLSGYPAIKDMRISVYPFWRGQVPEKTDRITVTVENNGG